MDDIIVLQITSKLGHEIMPQCDLRINLARFRKKHFVAATNNIATIITS